MNVLQEYLSTVGSLKTLAQQVVESGDSRPTQESLTLLKEISLDGFYEDLTSLVHESSACIEDLKKELAQVENMVQDGQGKQGAPKEGKP